MKKYEVTRTSELKIPGTPGRVYWKGDIYIQKTEKQFPTNDGKTLHKYFRLISESKEEAKQVVTEASPVTEESKAEKPKDDGFLTIEEKKEFLRERNLLGRGRHSDDTINKIFEENKN